MNDLKINDTIIYLGLLHNINEKIIFINKEYIITKTNTSINIINKSYIFKSNLEYMYSPPHLKSILNKNGMNIYIYE